MDKKVLTVSKFAEKVGVSSGLIYQGIASGKIKVADDAYLKEIGLDPEVISKPRRWIPIEEVEKFLNAPRTTAEDVFGKKISTNENKNTDKIDFDDVDVVVEG